MGNIILYLEDDAHMRKYTKELLEEDGYQVEAFRRTDQADKYINEHSDDIACIITDLNMSDEWLGDHRHKSDGCILTGWVWLQRFVFPKEGMENIPCIIYSGFNKYLEKTLNEKNESSLLEKPNIHLVDKGAGENAGYRALLKALKSIQGLEE